MNKEKKVYYYKEYTQDFVVSKNQNYKLPDNYKWIHKNPIYILGANIVYEIARIFAWFFCKIHLGTKVKNRKVLKECKGKGIFVFGNHTQEIADAFQPAIVVWPRRIYTVVSTANLGIPVLGKILPILGALPIPNDLGKMKEFTRAIKARINEKKCVIIYPEAHVWPYCTIIRDFPATSFHYPVEYKAPSVAMTTTYAKSRFLGRPKVTVYLDGPFYPDETLNKREQREKLRNQVYSAMKERSKNSTYEYISYIKEE